MNFVRSLTGSVFHDHLLFLDSSNDFFSQRILQLAHTAAVELVRSEALSSHTQTLSKLTHFWRLTVSRL
ncbi:hypothetical protein HA466_0193800 [Hirschfeldia incana]|nr:hypothetical protein HA466_0193800 [Hirschfeldia incana]